jgi:hypothetical protein
MRLPPQILRLVILFLMIVAGYLLMRSALMPATFGNHGWYRSAALGELAAQETQYTSRADCAGCHAEESELLSLHGHQSLSCVVCHGPGQEHAKDPGNFIGHASAEVCSRCHEAEPARPVWFKQVRATDHYPDWSCIECHLPHFPSEIQ